MIEFRLPDLGDGVEKGTVIGILVSEGDAVAVDQPLIEIEADKATIELPSSHAGTISALHVKVGGEVATGDLVVSIDPAGGGGSAPQPVAAAAQPVAAAAQPAAVAESRSAPQASAPQASAPSGNGGSKAPLPAGPAVRRLARLLGVDLQRVSGSGQRGRITAEDVHTFLKRLASGVQVGAAVAQPELPDFTQWGPVELEPLSPTRKSTAKHMARCWSIVPHVTHHDLADITELEGGRKEFRRQNPDVKLTMTVIVVKALTAVLKRFPQFNATLDLEGGQLIKKRHYHVGIAVDTPNGLLVPIVRDVDKKSVLELSSEVNELAGRARERKLTLAEMRGGTFTVSNLGGIGGTSFTPIVNWPEVAILGICRARWVYEVSEEGPVARLKMPLSLSYDHRVIDGAAAARFVSKLADLLASPAQLSFEV